MNEVNKIITELNNEWKTKMAAALKRQKEEMNKSVGELIRDAQMRATSNQAWTLLQEIFDKLK